MREPVKYANAKTACHFGIGVDAEKISSARLHSCAELARAPAFFLRWCDRSIGDIESCCAEHLTARFAYLSILVY